MKTTPGADLGASALGQAAGIHALRCTSASRILRSDVDMSTVMYVGGWRTAAVLQCHYVDLQDRDAERALRALPELRSRVGETAHASEGQAAIQS